MNLKTFFLVFIAIVPLTVSSQKIKNANRNQPNIAYVEQNIILKKLEGFEKNTKEVDSLRQVYSKEIQENTTQLTEKINNLLKPYDIKQNEKVEQIKSKLNENDLAKFELYLKEDELIEKSRKNYELVIKSLYNEKVQPLLNRVNQTIENYAKSHGILIVLTLENISPAIAYINKGINITDEINSLLK
jgi:Skp family chaperone for outer membrane proteins